MATRAEKEAVLDFAKYCDQRVRVRFQGGREVDGVLKGYDKLDNLVLEDSIEYLRGKIPVFVSNIAPSFYFDCLSSYSEQYAFLITFLIKFSPTNT